MVADFAPRRAGRARGIGPQAGFAEAHAERIEDEQATGEGFADAEDQLERLDALNDAAVSALKVSE